MAKKQRMRWSPQGAHFVATVRAAVVSGQHRRSAVRLPPEDRYPTATPFRRSPGENSTGTFGEYSAGTHIMTQQIGHSLLPARRKPAFSALDRAAQLLVSQLSWTIVGAPGSTQYAGACPLAPGSLCQFPPDTALQIRLRWALGGSP